MSKAQDPFAATSDPSLYVPRQATERALEALADAVWHQGGIAALLGPPGVGKSLLLRVLARRAEDALHCIHVPVPTLDPEGITLWVASRLPGGRRLGGSETLLEVARERPLLLLVEDAELLPADSARAIAELHRASAGAIRAVLAVNAEALPANLSEAFDPEIVQVSLDEAMDRDEAVEYVTRRLAAAGVPQSVAERFDPAAVANLHDVSGGNPARFNVVARGHMPVAARALTPRPPVPEDAGLWQDPFPLEPAVLQETPPPRDRARRRWMWGLSWAFGASALTFAVGLLLGLWLRGGTDGGGPRTAWEGLPERPARAEAPAEGRPEIAVLPTPSTAAPEAEGAEARRAPPEAIASSATPLATAPRIDPAPPPSPPTEGPEILAPASPAAPAAPATPSVAAIGMEASGPADLESPEAPVVRTPPRPEEAPVPAAATPEVAALPAPDEPASERSLERFAAPSQGEVGSQPTTETAGAARAAPAARDEPAPASRRALFAPELPPELTAELVLDADPAAFVEIDGRPFGPTPIRISGLRPGVHRLVAHFKTGETMSQELVLSSGSRELTLRGPVRRAPQPPATLPAAPADPLPRAPGLAQPTP